MEIAIDANENSATGGTGKVVQHLNLQSKDIITIFCDREDQWDLFYGESGFATNANGIDNHTITIGDTGQVFRSGSLVGSLDDGKTFFSVGTFTQITVLEGGPNPTLKLYCADSDKDNNAGFIKARIMKSS
ncbi:MAG: hypothetical protein JKY02_05365 [Flavobacteriaceae bacterium]|nr:hypothetical protein [Flavobacteriaceae bacterium]